MLLLRFSGVLWLRFEDNRLSWSSLFHNPPRNTRGRSAAAAAPAGTPAAVGPPQALAIALPAELIPGKHALREPVKVPPPSQEPSPALEALFSRTEKPRPQPW